jgi:hypothetical protein
MHDNPIPSTRLTEQHHTRAASWGGSLGASYLALEEHRQTAIAHAAQARMLRECTPATAGEERMPAVGTSQTLRALIFRILPRFASDPQSSS